MFTGNGDFRDRGCFERTASFDKAKSLGDIFQEIEKDAKKQEIILELLGLLETLIGTKKVVKEGINKGFGDSEKIDYPLFRVPSAVSKVLHPTIKAFGHLIESEQARNGLDCLVISDECRKVDDTYNMVVFGELSSKKPYKEACRLAREFVIGDKIDY